MALHTNTYSEFIIIRFSWDTSSKDSPFSFQNYIWPLCYSIILYFIRHNQPALEIVRALLAFHLVTHIYLYLRSNVLIIRNRNSNIPVRYAIR